MSYYVILSFPSKIKLEDYFSTLDSSLVLRNKVLTKILCAIGYCPVLCFHPLRPPRPCLYSLSPLEAGWETAWFSASAVPAEAAQVDAQGGTQAGSAETRPQVKGLKVWCWPEVGCVPQERASTLPGPHRAHVGGPVVSGSPVSLEL